MTKYNVFFEIFGKKMKATVNADSEEQAKYLISGQIIKKIKITEVQNADKEKELFNNFFGKIFN
jgi:hypothetical protein